MAYAVINFKSKKALKVQVANYNALHAELGDDPVANDEAVRIFSPGPFGCKSDGDEFLEGPHYPAPHSWYAAVVVRDGIVIKVKS